MSKKTINIYNFNPQTKEFVSEAPARLDPKESTDKKPVFLLPANATFEKVNSEKKGFARVFDGSNWGYEEDNRGKVIYNQEDGAKTIITELGPIPNGYGENEPELPVTWDEVKSKRNGLLSQSDWTQLPAAPFTTQKQAQWAEYRQALRDLTNQEDPNNITWPTEPK